jgi:hypothetical protein
MLLVIIDQMRTGRILLPKTPPLKANHKTYSTPTRAITIWPMIALCYTSIVIIQSTTIPKLL